MLTFPEKLPIRTEFPVTSVCDGQLPPTTAETVKEFPAPTTHVQLSISLVEALHVSPDVALANPMLYMVLEIPMYPTLVMVDCVKVPEAKLEVEESTIEELEGNIDPATIVVFQELDGL